MSGAFRVATLCAVLLGVAIPNSAFAQASCENAWQSLPVVLPSPTYISQNDPDLVYQDVTIRNWRGQAMWGAELAKAGQTFFQIRAQINNWESQLNRSEREFWRQFDSNGRASTAVRNEWAYWLHKREAWLQTRGDISFAVGEGAGGEMRQVMQFILGGNQFLLPAEFADFSSPRLNASIEQNRANASYRAHFERLVQLSFLSNSQCAPERGGTALGRITQHLLHPFENAESVAGQVRQINNWADGNNARLTELADKLTQASTVRGSFSTWDVAMAHMRGETDFVQNSIQSDLLRSFRAEPMLRVMGFDRRLENPQNFVFGDIQFGAVNPVPLKNCVYDNWDVIIRYFVASNPEFFSHIPRRFDEEANAIRQSIGREAVRACVSEQGLKDPEITSWLEEISDR